jgi:hypothetical protein
VLLSIRERDHDLHRPQRLRPIRRQRPAVGSAPPASNSRSWIRDQLGPSGVLNSVTRRISPTHPARRHADALGLGRQDGRFGLAPHKVPERPRTSRLGQAGRCRETQ